MPFELARAGLTLMVIDTRAPHRLVDGAYAQRRTTCEQALYYRDHMQDFVDKVLSHWQAFRAGIEGTISGLKRAFRLARCHYRGFKRFQVAVGLGVFGHNLVVLARQGLT